MEFHIQLSGATLDPDVVERAIRAVDAAALADIEPRTGMLRVATSLDAADLVALIVATGHPLARHQVTQLASTCCGGCGG